MHILALIFGISTTLALGSQTARPVAPPMKISICDVARNPDRYNGKILIFRAHFVTDHIERSLLVGDGCQDGAMLPYLAENAFGASSFTAASNVQAPVHFNETIIATFTGTFHFRAQPEMCMILNKEVCRRSFEIHRVDDLVLTMTPIEEKK